MSEIREVECTSIDQWASWLKTNHAFTDGVWLIFHKLASPQPSLDYDDMVCEALCWGWIDSRVARLDELRTKMYFSPRRRNGAWSASNKIRIERLVSEGRMQPSGTELVEHARRTGLWNKLDAVEALEIPDDLLTAFRKYPGSKKNFDAFSRSKRRIVLEWIDAAKRPATRASRVMSAAEMAGRNEAANFRAEKT